MATIEKATQPKKTRTEFVGRAWVNTAGEQSKYPGTKFITLRFDKGMKVSFGENDNIFLWPAAKRPGRQDADFRASIEVPLS
jgi:hypothetical protein